MRAALLVLVAFGAPGCLWATCGGAECPQVEPLVEGSYVGTFQDATTADVEVADDLVAFEYTDADGNTWRVEYAAALTSEE